MSRSTLYIGQPGLSMLSDALSSAKAVLQSENLAVHSDYLYVEPEKKQSMGVEEAELVVNKAMQRPAIAKDIVIVINGLDKMTVQGQNKLLKTFEEATHCIILAVCYSDQVLPTIRSRCEVKQYHPLTEKQFQAIVPDDARFYFRMTGGCPGLIKEMVSVESCFRKAGDAIRNNKEKDLLSAWNLVKEKDPNAITATSYVKEAVLFMSECYLDRLLREYSSETERKIQRLEAEKKVLSRPSYSKDDFFLLVADLITGGE